jgi:hypothetical protein
MGLRATYRPVDAVEQELVRAIAHASWQLRRAQALEEDWWAGEEDGLSLETILRYQTRAECARGRAMRELKLHRSGALQRKEEVPSPEPRPQAARLPPAPLPVPPSVPRTIEPEAYRRLWERYVEQDPGNVLKALIRTAPSPG